MICTCEPPLQGGPFSCEQWNERSRRIYGKPELDVCQCGEPHCRCRLCNKEIARQPVDKQKGAAE